MSKKVLTLFISGLLLFPLKAGFLGDLNPFKVVGGIAGGPFTAASFAPVVQDFENKGQNLIREFNARMDDRIVQFDSLIGDRIDTLNIYMETRLVQFDGIIKDNITYTDNLVGKRIKDVDNAIGKNLLILDNIVKTSINDFDEVLVERLDQFDEVVNKNFGLLDAGAIRFNYLFENAIIRVLIIGTFLFFVGYILLMLNRNGYFVKWTNKNADRKSLLLEFSRKFILPAGGVALILFLLSLVIHNIPGGPKHKIRQLVQAHEDQYDISLRSFDLKALANHAAHLAFLEPSNKKYKSNLLKAEIVRELFTRPTLVKNPLLLRTLMNKIYSAENYLNTIDPDLETIKSYIVWHHFEGSQKNYYSACLAASALKTGKNFPLKELAVNYLRNYVEKPLVIENPEPVEGVILYDVNDLKSTLDANINALDDPELISMRYVFDFNEMILSLSSNVDSLYINILNLNSLIRNEKDQNIQRKLIENRQISAKEIIKEWDLFRRKLENNEFVKGSSALVSLFDLNDAIYTRAQFYQAQINSEIPKGLSSINHSSRPVFYPPRVEFSRKYLNDFNKVGRFIMEENEFSRYINYEKKLIDLEKLFLIYNEDDSQRSDQDTYDITIRVAELASEVGLYTQGKDNLKIPFFIKLYNDKIQNLKWDEADIRKLIAYQYSKTKTSSISEIIEKFNKMPQNGFRLI